MLPSIKLTYVACHRLLTNTLLLLLVSVVTILHALPDCVTVSGDKSGLTCRLPFVYEGVLRQGCITQNDPDGLLWCSTRTNSSGYHIKGWPLVIALNLILIYLMQVIISITDVLATKIAVNKFTTPRSI